VRFDKLGLHHNKKVFVRLVAFSQYVIAINAAVPAGLTSPARLMNLKLTNRKESLVPFDLWPSLSGCEVDAHRLGDGSIHAMFVCRQQGFLANDSDDALWQELKQERFTTPLLRGWLPYIRQELELKPLLFRCYTLDCTCCVLSVTSADLHSIVEAGIKTGTIEIRADAA
jgi:hypothetical protein